MGTTVGLEKEVSCRVTNSVIKYVESLGYNTDCLVEGLPYPREYLADPFSWVTWEVRETICQRAANLVGDEAIMYQVGLATPKLNLLGGIEDVVRVRGSPKLAYESVPKYASFFDKAFEFKASIVGANQAVVTMLLSKGYPVSKSSCYYAQGILAAIPTLWGLPPAEVQENQCMCQPAKGYRVEGVEYDARTCVYQVTWQPMPAWYSKPIEELFRRDNKVSITAAQLEKDFQLLEQKNSELVRRNAQLAKVREIALCVDSVRTIEEALSQVVELARDIPGVRFVIVQRLDESDQFIVTPYYSRVRSELVAKALKSLGFDSDHHLGKISTSQKFRLPVAKLKVAQDYISNPRVIIKERLSELLDGVWGKALCDTVQRVANIKKCIITKPLLVRGECWGTLTFFLEDEVPTDIVEMVGAHCAIALNNVSTIESLERRNLELAAINTIAKQASSSLELSQILNNTLEETVHIFEADAAAIYLLDESSQALELVAHCGIPQEIAAQSKYVQIQGTDIGKFFTSNKDILVGDMKDYSGQLSIYSSLLVNNLSLPFASAALYSAGHRFGTVTVVRKGKDGFRDDERSLLLAISNHFSVAIQNARLHAAVLSRMKEAEVARKNLETALNRLAESKEKLRLTIESVAEGITVTDLAGNVLQVNEAVVGMHGYDNKEELIGRSAFEFIAERDRTRAIKNLKRTLDDGYARNIEYVFLTRDGQEFDAELSASVLKDASGNPVGFVAVTEDITERKRAADKLKAQKQLIDRILATMPNAVLVIDKDLRVTLANRAFYDSFNMEGDQVEGRPVGDVISIANLSEAIAEVLTHREAQRELEFRHKVGDCDRILVATMIAMGTEEVLLILNDLTDERERQERLYLTDRLASVGEMASGIAHELNNPLTSVIGLSQLLAEEDISDDAKEDVEAIYSEAQRAAGVVRNLLTFARKHVPVRQLAQINKVLDDMLKLRAYEHRVNNIQVDTRFAPELPEIMVDYFQMQQVFLNIILNAEAAMIEAHNQGTLTITTERIDNTIKVSFTDDGPGIAEDNLSRLFNPFFTTKEVGKGTGLGLSICYGIVTGHGGKIYAQSELGKGATFVVELPINVY